MSKRFSITDEEYKMVKDFVKKRKKDYDLYVKRGGFREEDIWTGAYGEIAAYKYLRSLGIDCSAPDFNIYDKRDKSYDADLRSSRRFFHVKAQSRRSQKLYGNSWLLQRYDKIVKKPIKRHYLILCAADIENREVEILGTPSVFSIHFYELFGECRHPAFRKSKVALYLKHICDKLRKEQLWCLE